MFKHCWEKLLVIKNLIANGLPSVREVSRYFPICALRAFRGERVRPFNNPPTQVFGGETTVEARSGGLGGNYNTNGLARIVIITNTAGTVTNAVDVGGVTNGPSRFYRVRLVP
jgi:glycerate-2-kinase